jgi:hypothetical protein
MGFEPDKSPDSQTDRIARRDLQTVKTASDAFELLEATMVDCHPSGIKRMESAPVARLTGAPHFLPLTFTKSFSRVFAALSAVFRP